MDAITAATTTAVIVIVGRWTQGKGLEAKIVIGAGFYAIMLSVIESSQPDFAGKIAALVLVTALLLYMIPITKALGYNTSKPGKYTPVPGLGGMA